MQVRSIGVFYGSTTGNTEEAAEELTRVLCGRSDAQVRAISVSGIDPARLLEFDALVVGCPTWDEGELQRDWECLLRRVGKLRLEGKPVALFGSGDALCYPDTFQDAQGILGAELRARGARLIGHWPTDGYTFTASRGVEDGHFLGLALDTDDSWTTTRTRLSTWADQLLAELARL
ncbi:flavodoxin [Armatimonas rosea]|uniref:Flavodoxin n=1 Tax=Armatimonas rosea TaxID=685828 RepID=A0A7W9SQA8_ARMRO|nr:flavodoxin [Armatimonas rosea]MBB6050228.1 flavodoxin long chain [Armatimonas rosea]